MGWFNYFGLIAIVIIMIPNVLCAIFDRSAFENKLKSRALEICEQAGRYGCMAFSVFNIPYTYFGFWFSNALTVYLSVGGGLLAVYWLGWLVFFKRRGLLRALWLSVTPTVFFAFCGITLGSVPLIICSVLFGTGHVTISCKNTETVI